MHEQLGKDPRVQGSSSHILLEKRKEQLVASPE